MAPTIALLGGTTNPVAVLTSRLTAVSWVVSIPVARPSFADRVWIAMTISSSELLPARSPMPLIVTSAWRAPATRPASVLAVASPRSSWQWTDSTTPSIPGTSARIRAISAPNSSGVV